MWRGVQYWPRFLSHSGLYRSTAEVLLTESKGELLCQSSLMGQECGSRGAESLLSSVTLHAEWDSASRSYRDSPSSE